jgi:hypothetical protein
MTSSSKSTFNMEKLMSELKEIKQMINNMQANNSVSNEKINLMEVKVSDVSSKVDMIICSPNNKNKSNGKLDNATNGGATDSPRTKKSPNIQQYCKGKYMDDPKWFIEKGLCTQAQIDEVFENNPEDIEKAKGKKDNKLAIKKAKSNLVYVHLFKTGDNLKNLRAMKNAEENDKIQVNSEMKESDTITSTPVKKGRKAAKVVDSDVASNNDASGEEEESD